jgi:hypothetical protein
MAVTVLSGWPGGNRSLEGLARPLRTNGVSDLRAIDCVCRLGGGRARGGRRLCTVQRSERGVVAGRSRGHRPAGLHHLRSGGCHAGSSRRRP